MIKKLFYTTVILSVATLVLVSCEKKINDAYLNPNAAVREPIETILPGVIGSFTYFYSSNGTGYGVVGDAQYIGRYIQNYSTQTDQENYAEMGGVTGASDATGAMWAAVYYGQGANVNKIIEWGTEEQKWDYVGVAWAIRAWGWLELTNEYNDAILKQAFDPTLQQFKYDSQPEFYDSCRAVCFRALNFLNRTDGSVSQANLAKGDAYFFNGDVNKWKKFVYGILARSYIDLSAKDLFKANNYAFADSAIKYANLAMTNTNDDAMVQVSGGLLSATNNYYGPFRGNIGSWRQCQYPADLMSGRNSGAFTGVNDPRAWYMLRENASGTFTGFVPWRGGNTPGLTSSTYPFNFWGHPTYNSTAAPAVDTSRYIFQNTSPWPMMTASEMQFVKAEAAYLKGDKATALAAYANGINLNFDMLAKYYPQHIPASKSFTLNPELRSTYIASVVPVSSANLSLTQIMLQKYIALYGWGTQETWVDMRKYHYSKDNDPITGKTVYADFMLPPPEYLVTTNNNKPVQRFKPRYNSEYLYDVPELTRIGAFDADYVTKECWFSLK